MGVCGLVVGGGGVQMGSVPLPHVPQAPGLGGADPPPTCPTIHSSEEDLWPNSLVSAIITSSNYTHTSVSRDRCMHTHAHCCTFSHAHSLTHSHARSHTRSHFYTSTHSHVRTHTHTHSHSYTVTHTPTAQSCVSRARCGQRRDGKMRQ